MKEQSVIAIHETRNYAERGNANIYSICRLDLEIRGNSLQEDKFT